MKYVFIGKETVTNISDVYDLFANAFDFPDYFGRNLDALYDCLTDASEQALIVLADKEYLCDILGEKAQALFDTIYDAAESSAHLAVREFGQAAKKKYTKEQIDELARKAGEAAGEKFMSGYNCCEATLGAVLDLGITDLPKETVMVGSAMGGGVGGFGSLCGAINGGGLAIGALMGRKIPTAAGDAKACKDELHDNEFGLYAFSKEYIEELDAKFGTVNCGELTAAYDKTDEEQLNARAQKCRSIVVAAAELAVRKAFEFEAKKKTK